AGPSVVQMLNLLERFDLAALGPGSAEAYHLIAEAQRLAFADRFAYVADPDFVAVPWAGLLDKGYSAERARLIDPARAADQITPGDPWRFMPTGSAVAARDAAPGPDLGCTTHISVIDRDRTMVSLTNTLVELFGSRVMAPGTGVIFNNAMTWF